MTKLIRYHTVQANPEHYWENNIVATQLKLKEIATYDEYKRACKLAGSACYIEEVFNQHLNNE